MNINLDVEVILTPHGEFILRRHDSSFLFDYRYDAQSKKLICSLWRWANIFGPHLYVGAQLFEGNEVHPSKAI